MKEIGERHVLNDPIDKKCPDRQTQRRKGDWCQGLGTGR